jgi:RimJ/RimL family protein N-acetyltransferase
MIVLAGHYPGPSTGASGMWLSEGMAPAKSWRVTLRGGETVILRPLTPADKPLIAASFERLGDQSRYRRFFLRMQTLPPSLLDALVDVDHHDREAIVAVSRTGDEALGVARYTRLADDPEAAEIAVTVVDDWQNRGLGLALLRRLTNQARRQGIRRFSAAVLAENPQALLLFASLGESSHHLSGGVLELVVDLPPERGIGIRLAEALRAAAAEALVPARTLADLVLGGR